MYEPSGLRGLCIGFIGVELLNLLFTYCCCVCMYVCMYVCTVGCIAPAIHRSRLGPLLAYEGRLGEKVRALGGHLQPRGASPPCLDSVFEVTAQGRDRTFSG